MTPKIMDFHSSISKEYIMLVMRRLPVAWDDYSKSIENANTSVAA